VPLSGPTPPSYADRRKAVLAEAYLREANLRGAKPGYVKWSGANLRGARYDAATTWPDGFDPEQAGAVYVDE
jgi:uncharacterized protein YjbI with pentapeptide repeats